MTPFVPLQGGYQCSRPFYDLLPDVFNWLGCPYTIDGLGLTGLGMFVLVAGFVGVWNQSESWEAPLTWLAIVAPAMAAGFLLPGSIVLRVAGAVTVAVAMLMIGLYWWFGRA